MKLERHPGPLEVAAAAADRVATVLEARPDAVILLPAGGTPIPLYAELVQRQRAGRLDLSRARLFQLDEMVGVGPSDPRGFQAFLHEHLLGPLGLEAWLLDGTAPDPVAEIERHGSALADLGGADLALLGIGRNGHVAFNEPGTGRHDGARHLPLSKATRLGQAEAFPEGAPHHGITLGLAEIAAAKSVVLLATGGGKAEVLERLLAGAEGTDLPAAWLRDHADFTVLADEAASVALR